jgi:glycosyltransferase involved in cell wall biosynthesis
VADHATARVAAVELREQIQRHTDLVAAAHVPATTRVSIVLPTRNRRELLLHAIASVRAQSHTNWELVVVDDGSTDGSAEAVAALGDQRIRVVRGEGEGAAAARNRGLAVATGDWVTFLDDDNTMAPHWVKAIARFAQHPVSRVLYGAQLREAEPDGSGSAREVSALFITPFDQARMLETNYIDLGALAVERGVPELSFRADVRRFIDWEMIARLAATETLTPLPVWSGVYFTDVEARITHATHEQRMASGAEFSRRLVDPNDPMGRPG